MRTPLVRLTGPLTTFDGRSLTARRGSEEHPLLDRPVVTADR